MGLAKSQCLSIGNRTQGLHNILLLTYILQKKSLALNIVTYILHNVIEVAPLRPEPVNIVMYIFPDYLFGQILDECILDHDAHIMR